MNSCTKKTAGLTFIEMVIAVAIFAQLTVLVGTTVMAALQLQQANKENKNVNLELYTIMTNGIGAYIRSSTGIMYDNHPYTVSNSVHQHDGILDSSLATGAEERICDEEDKESFDQLTLFTNKKQTEFISFAVEQDDEAGTSRLVWKKNTDNRAYYLNSPATYISCFWVSVSPNPYSSSSTDTNIKDIQPYVHIALAGRYRYAQTDANSFDFFDTNTYTSYKSFFTLRNYSY